MNRYTGSVKLVDKKTRVVEVLGPEPFGSKYPTERKLLFFNSANQTEYFLGPQPIGFCFQADGRTAKFIVDRGPIGDAFLDRLAKTRLAKPWGTNGWVVES